MKSTALKFILSLVALLSILSVLTFADANEPINASSEVINVIKLLEIANGDADGNMNYDKEVTRAEFVKMAINASTSKEFAANIKLNVSLFPDVKNSYWAAGYISVAINNGLVTGYIDGTFKPTNSVTLEEAATIVLRLLGYTNADLVGSYPSAQLQKYQDLSLDKNIDAQKGDKLSREECMILIYNALSAKTKNGSVYCTTLGLSASSEGTLDYSALLEDKLDGPVTVSENADVFEGISFNPNDKTQYFLNSAYYGKNAFNNGDVIYYSDVINAVFAYRKTATGIVESTTGTSVKISGKTYNLGTSLAKDKLSFGGEFSESKSFVTLLLGINDTVVDVIKGDVSRISENDDNSTHLSMIDATISKAIYLETANDVSAWESKIPFPTDSATMYFNGKETDNIAPAVHDVVYYSKPFNSIWVYRKTASGKIEAISTPTSPTGVTVSGKSYNIVSSTAAYDLSIYGSYEIGDRISLILGINDECVAIADTAETSGIIYGVITSLGEKTYKDKDGEDYTADFVSVTDSSNTTYTYEFSNRYLSVCDVVKVAVADNVSISKMSTDIGRSTALKLSSAILNSDFSSNCTIIDVKGSTTIKVSPERIAGTVIDVEQFTFTTPVLYYEFDDNGDICKLILNNFTGDIDKYGIVTASSGGKITYMTDRNKKTLQTEGNGCSVGAARFRTENGTIKSANALIGNVDNVENVTDYAVYDSNGKEYLCAEDVKVFIRKADIYTFSSISEVSDGSYDITAYFDKLPENGGRIRVIIASKKG